MRATVGVLLVAVELPRREPLVKLILGAEPSLALANTTPFLKLSSLGEEACAGGWTVLHHACALPNKASARSFSWFHISGCCFLICEVFPRVYYLFCCFI